MPIVNDNRAAAADPPFSADQAREVAGIFHLLGEPNRLSIVAGCLAGPRSVADLAAAAGVSASLASHHLRLLKGARLVRAERRGKNVLYSVHDHHVRRILADMIEHVNEPAGNDPAATDPAATDP